MSSDELAFWDNCFTAAITGVLARELAVAPAEVARTAALIADEGVKQQDLRRRKPEFQTFTAGANRQ